MKINSLFESNRKITFIIFASLFVLILFTFISFKRDWPSFCAEYGSGVNAEKNGCLCATSDAHGHCISPPHSETFSLLQNTSNIYYVQRRGSKAHVSLNTKVLTEAVIENTYDFDVYILKSHSIVMSVPNYPSKASIPWTYQDCLFQKLTKNQLRLSTPSGTHVFYSYCSNSFKTLYLVRDDISIQAFGSLSSGKEIYELEDQDLYWNVEQITKKSKKLSGD